MQSTLEESQLLRDLTHEDLAYASLRYFSEYCWSGTPGHLPNGVFHNEWYNLLGDENRPERLHIQAPREHAKTTCISVKYPLWRVGRNPNLRVVYLTKTATLGNDIMREVRRNIEYNPKLQSVFPHLVPSKPWTDMEMFIRRPLIDKNPTFRSTGIEGAMTGWRSDLLIIDDPFDENEVQTALQRQKIEKFSVRYR